MFDCCLEREELKVPSIQRTALVFQHLLEHIRRLVLEPSYKLLDFEYLMTKIRLLLPELWDPWKKRQTSWSEERGADRSSRLSARGARFGPHAAR